MIRERFGRASYSEGYPLLGGHFKKGKWINSMSQVPGTAGAWYPVANKAYIYAFKPMRTYLVDKIGFALRRPYSGAHGRVAVYEGSVNNWIGKLAFTGTSFLLENTDDKVEDCRLFFVSGKLYWMAACFDNANVIVHQTYDEKLNVPLGFYLYVNAPSSAYPRGVGGISYDVTYANFPEATISETPSGILYSDYYYPRVFLRVGDVG